MSDVATDTPPPPPPPEPPKSADAGDRDNLKAAGAELSSSEDFDPMGGLEPAGPEAQPDAEPATTQDTQASEDTTPPELDRRPDPMDNLESAEPGNDQGLTAPDDNPPETVHGTDTNASADTDDAVGSGSASADSNLAQPTSDTAPSNKDAPDAEGGVLATVDETDTSVTDDQSSPDEQAEPDTPGRQAEPADAIRGSGDNSIEPGGAVPGEPTVETTELQPQAGDPEGTHQDVFDPLSEIDSPAFEAPAEATENAVVEPRAGAPENIDPTANGTEETYADQAPQTDEGPLTIEPSQVQTLEDEVPEPVTNPVGELSDTGRASYETLVSAVDRAATRTPAEIRDTLSPGQLAAGQEQPWLQNMYVGSDLENAVALDPQVFSDPNIVHLGTSQPGQRVADFIIKDGTADVSVDVTGSSRSSVSDHLGRDYIDSREQILNYPTFTRDFLDEVFKK